MAIYKVRAPAWKEKCPEFIRTSMESPKCRFCDLNEAPLAETRLFRVIEAKYPYLPEHAIAISKRHVKGIDSLEKEELDELLGMIGRIGRISEEIKFIANQGLAAGQSIPHFHMHIIRKFEENDRFVRLMSGSARFKDPFSRIILQNAGLYGEDVNLEIDRENAEESVKRIKSMFARLSARYYYMMESRCAEAPEKYSDVISNMVNERLGHELGINWSIDGKGTCMTIIPRAIRQKDADNEYRMGATELFLGLRLERNGNLSENDLGIWLERQERFHGEIRDALNRGRET